MSAQEIIRKSAGELFIHNVMDDASGFQLSTQKVGKQEAETLVAGADIHAVVQDDGIGVLVFYKGDPEEVHTLLYLP